MNVMQTEGKNAFFFSGLLEILGKKKKHIFQKPLGLLTDLIMKLFSAHLLQNTYIP